MQKTTNINTAGQQILNIISKAASKLGVSEEEVAEKIENLEQEDQVTVFKALQDFIGNNPSPQTKEIINKVFPKKNTSAFKNGGKIKQFVCKHAKGGKANCGCMDDGGKVEKAEGDTAGVNSKLPGFKQAKKNAKRAVYENIGRRKFGTYQDENGNTYAYEWGDVNGNTAETFVLMQPNDTSGTQFISTKYGDTPVYFNQKSDSWKKSIGPRFRASVPIKQEGGQIEKGRKGMYVRPDNLSRREAIDLARSQNGYNWAQAVNAYANAKNASRSQGLRGRELRQNARRIIAGYNGGAQTVSYVLPPTMQSRIVPMNSPAIVITNDQLKQITADRIQQNINANNFNTAFGYARKLGRKVFDWRGNKYGTKLATSPAITVPVIDDTVNIEDVNIPTIEFVPVQNTVQPITPIAQPQNVVVSPSFASSNVVPEIITPEMSNPGNIVHTFTPSYMRGQSPYMNMVVGSNVPQGWYMQESPSQSVVTVPVQEVPSEDVTTKVFVDKSPYNPGLVAPTGAFKINPSFMRGKNIYEGPDTTEYIPQGWYLK